MAEIHARHESHLHPDVLSGPYYYADQVGNYSLLQALKKIVLHETQISGQASLCHSLVLLDVQQQFTGHIIY